MYTYFLLYSLYNNRSGYFIMIRVTFHNYEVHNYQWNSTLRVKSTKFGAACHLYIKVRKRPAHFTIARVTELHTDH